MYMSENDGVGMAGPDVYIIYVCNVSVMVIALQDIYITPTLIIRHEEQ